MDNQPYYQPQQVPAQPVMPPQAPRKRSKAPYLFLWLLILILAAGIAGVYLWQHNKVSNLQSQLTAADKSTVAKNPPASSTSSSKQYLYLYTYGLKLPLTKGIQDLYYLDASNSKPSGDTLTFSTESLTNDDLACTAEPGTNMEFLYQSTTDTSATPQQTTVSGSPFGLVTITPTAVPQSQVGSLDQDVGISIAHLNSYYIYYKSPQTPCSSSTSTENTTQQQKDLFVTALKNIQTI